MEVLPIILLVAGLVLVLGGSDALVDGASGLARRSGMSEFVIGMTIVGIGTSMPELVVSWLSAIENKTDMSVGNIVGSNIFNTLLILGATAVVLPIGITRQNFRRDMPINIAAALLLVICGMSATLFKFGDDCLNRIEGAGMLALFVVYMVFAIRSGKQDNGDVAPQAADMEHNSFKATEAGVEGGSKEKIQPLWKDLALVVLGLVALIAGGKLFVDNAVIIAKALGWSDKFIGITILAGGTSLPELATCLVAAAKKKDQLALGNILGSNISNILLILGGAALIRPIPFANVTFTDMGFLLLSAIILPLTYFSFDKHKIGRFEGFVLLFLEAAYMYLLIRAL